MTLSTLYGPIDGTSTVKHKFHDSTKLTINREHDKNPELFFNALFTLLEEGLNFKVSVLGEKYEEVPGLTLRMK